MIVRKVTEKAFVTEIEALYIGSEEVMKTDVSTWQGFKKEVSRLLLHTMTSQCLPQLSIFDPDDLFFCGLDSLEDRRFEQALDVDLLQTELRSCQFA